METPLSPRLIASVLDDIDSGRPLWGMLRVNEVVPTYHPVRRVLVERARRNLSDVRAITPLDEKIFAGRCLSELTGPDRIEASNEAPLKRKGVPSPVVLPLARRSRYRRPMSGRYSSSTSRTGQPARFERIRAMPPFLFDRTPPRSSSATTTSPRSDSPKRDDARR